MNNLCSEERITWRLKKMDKTMIGDYLGVVSDYGYKK